MDSSEISVSLDQGSLKTIGAQKSILKLELDFQALDLPANNYKKSTSRADTELAR